MSRRRRLTRRTKDKGTRMDESEQVGYIGGDILDLHVPAAQREDRLELMAGAITTPNEYA